MPRREPYGLGMHTTTRVLAGVALAVGLVGCSAGAGGGDSADTGGMIDAGAEIEHAGAEAAQSAAGRDASGVEAQRQVITTAHAVVLATDPTEAADDLAASVTALGGRVQDRHTWAGDPEAEGDLPYASITARVPADQLTGLIEDLGELGSVQEVSSASEDVTRQVVDLDARIAALETSTERLRGIMAEATDSADLLAAEEALSERQGELESYLSQREHLADQVAMSTLTVELQPTAAPAQVETAGFVGGLASGWGALLSFASALLVIAGTLIPWALAFGVPAAVVLLVLRRRRRRRRAVAGAEA